jgi:hypothetical protein
MFRLSIKGFFLACAACCLLTGNAYAQEKLEKSADSAFSVRTGVEHGLSFAAVVLSHRALRNSETLHSWPFFGFAAPMGWSSDLKADANLGRFVSLKGDIGGNLTLFGFGLKTGLTVELLHLLELGVEGNMGSAINYGSLSTFMGVFDPEKKDYTQDVFLTEFSYGVRYSAGLSIPLMVILPKSTWTRIILRPKASLLYSGYTGAEDGEVWKAGGANMVNGYSFQLGGTLLYMLPFRHFPMAMVSFGVRGFLNESDFDDRYKPYDPGFRTVSVTPMLSIKLNDRWGCMLMVPILRDRRYKNYRYESGEEMLQERVGAEWTVNAVMLMLTWKI